MRRVTVALVLIGALLAGCLGGRSDGNGGTDPTPSSSESSSSSSGTPTPAPLPPPQVLDLLLAFDFKGCNGLGVQHNRPLDDVQALLPEGFTAVPAPDSTTGTGVLAVDLFQCGNLTTAAVAVPNVYLGLVYTYVQRPVDRVPGAPDSAVHEYVFRLLSGERVLAALWPAAGYDTYNGSASVTVGPPLDGPDPLVRLGQGTVGSEYFLVATGISTSALPGARTQSFARYTVLPSDQSVLLWTGTYDFAISATGTGFVEVADDDPFATYATPQRPALAGTSHQYDVGAVLGQDLRRIFT
ncbi:MAG: hypothetical protein AABY18_08185 [Candidatus Thermoplasmatota archaeon]